MTTIHLMRHGHVHNPNSILYGRMPGFSLSHTGIAQAHHAGKWLSDKPITAIYTSPMQRAQQTADIIATYHSDLQPSIDHRLIEVSTPYEGQPTAELAANGWDLYTGNRPPHELPQTVLQRVLDFFNHAQQQRRGESIIAVAHGDILVFSWLHFHGFAPEALMKDDLMRYNLPVDYPATAAVMTFNLDQSSAPPSYHCPY